MAPTLREDRLPERAEEILYELASNKFLSTEQLTALSHPTFSEGQLRYVQRLVKDLEQHRYINAVAMREQTKLWQRRGGRRSFLYGLGQEGARYLNRHDPEADVTEGGIGYRRKQTNFRLSKLPHRVSVNHFYVACARCASELDHVSFEWDSEDEYPAERLYARVKSVTGSLIDVPFKPDGRPVITTASDRDRKRMFFLEMDRHTETGDSPRYGLTTKTLGRKFRGYLEINRAGGKCFARELEEMKDGYGDPVKDEINRIQKVVRWMPRRLDEGFTVLVVTRTKRRRDYLRQVAADYCLNAAEKRFFWFATEPEYYNADKGLRLQDNYRRLQLPIWVTAEDSNTRFSLFPSS